MATRRASCDSGRSACVTSIEINSPTNAAASAPHSSARLDFVVEPWFLSDAGTSSPGGREFAEFRATLEAAQGVKFFARVEDVPPAKNGSKRLAIISARKFFRFPPLS